MKNIGIKIAAYLAITVTALHLSGCVDPDPADDAPDAGDYGDAPDLDAVREADAITTPPEPEVGGFCYIECVPAEWDGDSWPGDDTCGAAIGITPGAGTVCLDDGLCHLGVRFHGAAFPLAPAPADETCPEDANGNGVCAVGDVQYTTCL